MRWKNKKYYIDFPKKKKKKYTRNPRASELEKQGTLYIIKETHETHALTAVERIQGWWKGLWMHVGMAHMHSEAEA